MSLKTSDLCDANESQVRVADPNFRSYGKKMCCSGAIATVKVFEDNVLVSRAE